MTATVVGAAGSARALGAKQRRTVFKHALEKPFVTRWPVTEHKVREDILDSLCVALQPISAYFAESRRIAKQRKIHKNRTAQNTARAEKAAKKGEEQKEQKGQPKKENEPPACSIKQIIADSMESSETEAAKAGLALMDHVVIGINSTTRALEKQIRSQGPDNAATNDSHNQSAGTKNDIALVVVCKGDLDMPMIAHFPGLAHMANENLTKHNPSIGGFRLVGLVEGSECKLGAAVGHKRVSVIGIRAGSTVLDPIIKKAQIGASAPVVPWISTENADAAQVNPKMHPMAVRELQTTAPIQKKKSNMGNGNSGNKGSTKSQSQKPNDSAASSNKRQKTK
ncbi:RNase P and RNase MRP subunit [Coemansia sp. RSA 1722]|nr:RNase P and RNase MRP subunit [Coemansia sp. RSA 486]KAJ2232603.1 RNase P and RNase MRP subunit [Coemansia sp. RSA 485]KAJ2605108.1 RNase P and RNase MRP subunit [Coemansia sp. RSA 1722]